jgi:alpha-tubulin suppressor-like RCC1 family protein
VSIPRRILSLERHVISKVATGGFHVIALTDENKLFTWGRNNKGQLGLGSSSVIAPSSSSSSSSSSSVSSASISYVEQTYPIQIPLTSHIVRFPILDIAAGFEHSIMLLKMRNKDDIEESAIYGWGDESRGQLGGVDKELRHSPQENRYISKFCRKYDLTIKKIVSGGFHNLALINVSGQVISWGGERYFFLFLLSFSLSFFLSFFMTCCVFR